MKKIVLSINNVFYYGWVIVILSAMIFFLSAPGQTYSISVFIKVYIEEFGLSSTQLSLAYTIATTISGTLLIFTGKFIDKFGSRKVLVVVAMMLGFSTFFNSFVSSIYMIFFGFFLLRYFGQGSMTLIPNILVPQWFEKKRAIAVSFAGIGGLAAMFLVPSLNLYMISSIGWENAWRVWSLILIVGFVPIVILLTADRPEDFGLTIENSIPSTNDTIEHALLEIEKKSFSIKQALKTKEFWIVGMISMIPAMFSTGVTFHFFPMMELRGLSNETAAVILGFMALPALALPFGLNVLVDIFKDKYILLTTLSMIIISMIFLIVGVTNMVTALIFILFYGFAVAVQSLTTNVIWPNYFGRKHLGTIRGAATFFMVIGSALGPLPFGLSVDYTGDYNLAIIGMIIFTTTALILSALIDKPVKDY